jgi:hypothetical protein
MGENTVEANILSVMVLTTFGLLILVTGGIGYLTVTEWRDRMRREDALKSVRPTGPKQFKSPPKKATPKKLKSKRK